jgi:hypothetical protein
VATALCMAAVEADLRIDGLDELADALRSHAGRV